MTDRELMQQALEALEYMHEEKCEYMRRNKLGDPLRENAARFALPAITALRERLAQPEQEPVAWRYRGNLHEFDPSDWAEGPVTPLYTTPPRREWAGLTDREIEEIARHEDKHGSGPWHLAFARAIEAKLKEKNA